MSTKMANTENILSVFIISSVGKTFIFEYTRECVFFLYSYTVIH